MKLNWIISPDGAHEALRATGFWFFLTGIAATVVGFVALRFGWGFDGAIAAFIAGGGFLALGVVGLAA